MISSLADAWAWYESARTLTLTMRRLGQKHWDNFPPDSDLFRDDHLRDVEAAEIAARSAAVLDDLDDLCVLLLFSVFEATIRDRVLAEISAELPTVRHVSLQHALASLKESIEHGSFFRVLEPYKGIDANLIEEVNQVRRYRNWVAHGRRGPQPAAVDPEAAFQRLRRFMEGLESPQASLPPG